VNTPLLGTETERSLACARVGTLTVERLENELVFPSSFPPRMFGGKQGKHLCVYNHIESTWLVQLQDEEIIKTVGLNYGEPLPLYPAILFMVGGGHQIMPTKTPCVFKARTRLKVLTGTGPLP